jgi:hypothetical protein
VNLFKRLKDVPRTFPGHSIVDSEEGQEKLKRVLEAFARRNKAIGYCQVDVLNIDVLNM